MAHKKGPSAEDLKDKKPWLVFRYGKDDVALGYFWGPGHPEDGQPARFGPEVLPKPVYEPLMAEVPKQAEHPWWSVHSLDELLQKLTQHAPAPGLDLPIVDAQGKSCTLWLRVSEDGSQLLVALEEPRKP